MARDWVNAALGVATRSCCSRSSELFRWLSPYNRNGRCGFASPYLPWHAGASSKTLVLSAGLSSSRLWLKRLCFVAILCRHCREPAGVVRVSHPCHCWIHLNNPNGGQLIAFVNTVLAGVGSALLSAHEEPVVPLGVHWVELGARSLFGLRSAASPKLRLTHCCSNRSWPGWLTGGGYGIEGGIACTIALVFPPSLSGGRNWFPHGRLALVNLAGEPRKG